MPPDGCGGVRALISRINGIASETPGASARIVSANNNVYAETCGMPLFNTISCYFAREYGGGDGDGDDRRSFAELHARAYSDSYTHADFPLSACVCGMWLAHKCTECSVHSVCNGMCAEWRGDVRTGDVMCRWRCSRVDIKTNT